MQRDNRCLCCDQPVSDHGPYTADDCVCRRCCEEAEYLSRLKPEPFAVRCLWIAAITLALIVILCALGWAIL